MNFDCELLERAIAAQVHPIAGSAITARKTMIVSVGLFDEGLWRLQDRDLLLRCAGNGFGATVLGAIDWIKYNSPDFISRQRGGYVTAYADLIGRHPQIRKRYPEIVAYMVARRILNHLIQGHLGQVIEEYRINRQRPELGFPLATLATGYLPGRRRRRVILMKFNHFRDKIWLPNRWCHQLCRKSPMMAKSQIVRPFVMKSFRSQISSEVANRFRTAVDRGMPDLGKAERGVERVRPKIGRVRLTSQTTTSCPLRTAMSNKSLYSRRAWPRPLAEDATAIRST